jgi:hypothetical protein
MAVNKSGLDPQDPLIPMPWQMDSIRAYRANNAAQAAVKAEEDSLKMEKLRQDVEKGRQEAEKTIEETPVGKAKKAADITAFLEQQKQQEYGIPIGEEMGARMTAPGGPSILEASKMQGELDIESKMRKAKIDSAKNSLIGGKSLMQTADVGMGGVKQTVLASEAGAAGANIYGQIYTSQVPILADTYIAEGYDRDTAVRMASADVRKELVKASTGGKVILSVGDNQTMSYSNEEAERKWRDPQTPKAIKAQLNLIFGQQEEPQAASWIKSRLGR